MRAQQQRVGTALELALQLATPADTLLAAMQYATLNGGKRLRAMLVYATGEAFEAEPSALDSVACAVEMIHAYSLIHDDMPMMDNDDLRRGRPSCHKAFDESTALLAGDALQTLAFHHLSETALLAEQKLAMIRELAFQSGIMGMAGGQALDLQSVGSELDLTTLQQMHRLKTGALIEASVMMGVYCAPEVPAHTYPALRRYAAALGLAFQVQDDVLDVIADTQTLGKQQGADAARDKPTYPALLGLANAQDKAKDLIEEALTALAEIPVETQALAALARFVVQREF
ncbi:Polyprenyl synthetase [Methylophaga frappieri]|uniref:Polyprenyl synthetase n=1 Tax=Methylophaga frappieri (strain ATCC BAA-2434 / DSM 25690 / JAM7) TaxID=754477 RepID=I1YG05_METFJ|nr:Polyprenyl synthetase [Methylophaga frappieri]